VAGTTASRLQQQQGGRRTAQQQLAAAVLLLQRRLAVGGSAGAWTLRSETAAGSSLQTLLQALCCVARLSGQLLLATGVLQLLLLRQVVAAMRQLEQQASGRQWVS
jgi:hypothetical protein